MFQTVQIDNLVAVLFRHISGQVAVVMVVVVADALRFLLAENEVKRCPEHPVSIIPVAVALHHAVPVPDD